MRLNVWFLLGAACIPALAPGPAARALSLEEALARAAQRRFEIAAIPREVAAAEARVAQASVRPAVELGLATRNALEESAVELAFVHERGGKRAGRVGAARAELDALGAHAEVRRLEVGREVRSAFAAVLAAEEAERLAGEAHALARSLADTVAQKVRAGAASPIEETRASVRRHGVAAAVERARRDVALARADLALAVGDAAVRSEPLAGRLPEDTTVPEAAAPAASPDLARLEQEVRLRRALLAAERAQASRDVSWRVAANHSALDDEAWVSAGLTVPLGRPRNAGALAAAAAEVERAELERAAAERELAAKWERGRAAVAAAAREAAILRDEVLAGASQAFATVQEGYRLGKFPYLDVLDASQVLLDARLQYTEALAALAQARIDVDRLLGATDLAPTTAAP